MHYISTRGQAAKVTASQAIVQGLAEDGGLYVPERIPALEAPLPELLALPYTALACKIMAPFLDFPEAELARCVEKAYAPARFRSPLIAPLVPAPFASNAASVHFLELFHGPTLAFKDMALSILPHLLKVSVSQNSQNAGKTVILTATSGDTGKAALEAFCDVEDVSIVVFYPEKGVSAMQKQQMVTQEGANTFVFGVEGNFDDAQTGVKAIFSDTALRSAMASKDMAFSSANSINIGRLLPQVVYYFYAYGQLVQKGALQVGQPVNFVVPTGNFGNILAGYYAQKMGLPIQKLVCASNDNKVLYDFFRTGTYDKNRPFHCTISPSMDILVSSNLERLLFHATDADRVRAMMGGLSEAGRFEVPVNLPDFYGVHTREDEARQAIASCARQGYVMDPHTAVAYHAGQVYAAETGDRDTPQVVISTASPFKFSEDVLAAMGTPVRSANFMEAADSLAEASGLAIPGPIAELARKPVRHTTTCAIPQMQSLVAQKVLGL